MYNTYNATFVWVGVAVVIALGAVALFIYMRKRNGHKMEVIEKHKEHKVEQREETSPTIVLYHADWCPHCVRMLPEWQKMTQELKGRVVVKEMESKHPDIHNHDIKGFPTIRLYPKGDKDYVEYKGERSADKLAKFALNGSM